MTAKPFTGNDASPFIRNKQGTLRLGDRVQWTSNKVTKEGKMVFLAPEREDMPSAWTGKKNFVENFPQWAKPGYWSSPKDMTYFSSHVSPGASQIRGDSVGVALVLVTRKAGKEIKPTYYSPRTNSLKLSKEDQASYPTKTAKPDTSKTSPKEGSSDDRLKTLCISLSNMDIPPQLRKIRHELNKLPRVRHARLQVEMRDFDPFIDLINEEGLVQESHAIEAHKTPAQAQRILTAIEGRIHERITTACDQIQRHSSRIKDIVN